MLIRRGKSVLLEVRSDGRRNLASNLRADVVGIFRLRGAATARLGTKSWLQFSRGQMIVSFTEHSKILESRDVHQTDPDDEVDTHAYRPYCTVEPSADAGPALSLACNAWEKHLRPLALAWAASAILTASIMPQPRQARNARVHGAAFRKG